MTVVKTKEEFIKEIEYAIAAYRKTQPKGWVDFITRIREIVNPK